MLKSIREQQGLTQQEVADAVGISVTYLSKLENGKVNLTYPMAMRLCEVLKCDAGKIFTQNHDK